MALFLPFKRAHGIDISDFAIRCAEVSPSPKGIRIHAFNEIPVEPGLIFEGEVRSPERVKELLLQLYKSKKGTLSSPFVVIAVPERKTFTKVISLDAVPLEQLQDAIQWEAEQQFPIDAAEMNLTWSLLENTQQKQTVLLSATNRSILDTYTTLLKSIGKHVIIAEPEPIAIQRVLLGSDPTPTLIVDLGASKTSISIVVEGIIRYTSTITFSGKILSRAISSALSLSPEQSEKAKLLFGLNEKKGKGTIRKVLAPQFEPLLQHLQDLQDYYATHFEELPKISHMILCGGGAQLPDLPAFLQKATGLETKVRVPAIHKKSKIERQFPEEKFSSFATAFGLGLRGSTEQPFDMIAYD